MSNTAEVRLAAVVAAIRSDLAGHRYVAALSDTDLFGSDPDAAELNENVRDHARSRVARCEQLLELAGVTP